MPAHLNLATCSSGKTVFAQATPKPGCATYGLGDGLGDFVKSLSF